MTTITQQPMQRPSRPRGFVGPLFLIGAGVVLLMNTLGFWGWDVWAGLLRLWPLLLVAGGLELLVGRRSAAAELVVVLVVVLMFAAGIWFVSSDRFSPVTFEPQVLNQEVAGAERAEVTLEGGVGTFRVSETSDSGKLVVGEIELARNEEASESFEMRGDTAVYSLATSSRGTVSVFPFWPRNDEKLWAVQLNGELPMELSINTGVGEAILDLAELDITDLAIHTGVGETRITLPAVGEYSALVEAGVGEVTIGIPDELAAHITVSTGIGSVDVNGDFEQEGDTYVSPEWSSAENRVTLRVDAGIGTVTINSER